MSTNTWTLAYIQGIDRIKMADDHDVNRKLLEKQRVQNSFASYVVQIGHFFTMSMLLSVL